MKIEHKFIIITFLVATVTTVIFFNRINDMAQPDEFDKEIAQMLGIEPKPNVEQWIVYLMTFIFFISVIIIGLIYYYLYKRKLNKMSKGSIENKNM